MRPLSIELRKLRTGVGYRTTSVSRSPSPMPPPRKAPVKIIRPPKEPVASTSRVEQHVAKATPQTGSKPKAKAWKSAPAKLTPPSPPPHPPKQSSPVQPLPPLPTIISPPPPPHVPFAPSDFYISMMSGLAMANMPQAMQVAAAADPMAAFQLAQMCFASSSAYPLPPFPLIPPQPDPAAVQPQLHVPKPSPKPISNSITRSNPKSAPPPVPPSLLQEDNTSSVSTSDTLMDLLVLKLKRQARKNNIGWIPEPGFSDRGTFNLVPTHSYAHWSSSDDVSQPDPQRSLVMEDLPLNCRTTKFVRSWSDQFSATAVYLNGGGKALIEFPSREVAKQAYDSPRLRDGLYKRATHVRVFWYRPQAEGSPSSTKITSVPEEPDVDDPIPPEETIEIGETARSRAKGKGFSLPPPEHDLPDIDLPVRYSTAPTPSSQPELPLPFATIPFPKTDDHEQSQRLDPVELTTDGCRTGSEHTPSGLPVSPSPSPPSTSYTKATSPPLCSPSPETIQPERTPTGSPPSLRYPSSTPDKTNQAGGIPSPSEGTSAHDTPSPSISEPSMAGDSTLEQELRMRLLAMKQSKIAIRNSEQSSSTPTPSTVVDPDPDIFFKVGSPLQHVSQIPGGIVASESLEFLAASFIADTLQAAQGLPSEPGRFDAAIKARLSRKRGSGEAFGTSADIAFKRQRLAQQIEESKRIMERLKVAETKEERSRIYVLWEESNRFVSLNRADYALTLLRNPFSSLFLGPWSRFRSPQLRPFSGHATRKDVSSSTATMRRSRWTRLDRQSRPSLCRPSCSSFSVAPVDCLMSAPLSLSRCISTALLTACFYPASLFPTVVSVLSRLDLPTIDSLPSDNLGPALVRPSSRSDHGTRGDIFVHPRDARSIQFSGRSSLMGCVSRTYTCLPFVFAHPASAQCWNGLTQKQVGGGDDRWGYAGGECIWQSPSTYGRLSYKLSGTGPVGRSEPKQRSPHDSPRPLFVYRYECVPPSSTFAQNQC